MNILENTSNEIRANIPVKLFSDKGIKHLDICLYIVIDQLSYKNGYCWATNTTLANILQTSDSTIKRSLKALEKRNYIIRKTIKRNSISIRNLIPVKAIKKGVEIDGKPFIELFDYDYLNEE